MSADEKSETHHQTFNPDHKKLRSRLPAELPLVNESRSVERELMGLGDGLAR